MSRIILLLACLIAFSCACLHAENEFENAPIRYSSTTPKDAVQALQKKLHTGSVSLDRTDARSVLRDLMKHFKIPESSQVLVFSKTSKQNHLINPQTPRAIYFGDNAYLGYCLGGSIEVTTIDPVLGPIFYLVEPDTPTDKPLTFERDQSCLSCHGGPFSPDVPGVLVRSVFPGREGHPLMNHGSTIVDTTTPFSDRWGGWYVTGHHGSARHRGNATLDDRDDSATIDTEPGANLSSLSHLFDTEPYPTPQSDIVALMVLEHQTSIQNILTKSNHAAIRAMHMQKSLQKELGEPVINEPVGTARRIIDNVTNQILDALLFKDEAALPDDGIEGRHDFQTDFAANSPKSQDGRSLKDFQLLNRLFKYRCSFMIYSITFQNLIPPLKETVISHLDTILAGQDISGRYNHLTDSERTHIRRILTDTLPDLFTKR
jgi:hypothetical protein